MRQLMREYIFTVQEAVGRIDPVAMEAASDALFEAFLDGRQVFTMGNGASAALASHMACDLGKGSAVDLGLGPLPSGARRLRIVSMADNAALLTAYGNDIGYDDVFVEQLKNALLPRDVVIGISGSGGSPNVLRAMTYARARGAVTIGLTGRQPTWVKLRALCDVCLQAPLTMMEQIEDAHVICSHVLSLALRERVAAHHRGTAALRGSALEDAVFAANDD